MITYLNILIDLLLIFAVWGTWRISSKAKELATKAWVKNPNYWEVENLISVEMKHYKRMFWKQINKLYGIRNKNDITAKVAEKFAERAFTMASTANLGVIALQKTLQTPRFMTKEQSQRNQLAKNEVEELYNGEDSNGSHDYLASIPEFLTKDEQQIFDIIEEQRMKEANKKH